MAARAAVDVNRRTHIVAAQPLVVQLVGPRVHSSETAIISAEESTRARLLVAQLLGDAPGSPTHPLAEQTSTQHINTQSSGVPGTEPQWSSRYGTPSDEGTPPGTQPPPRTSLLGLSIEDQQTPSTLDAEEESFVAGTLLESSPWDGGVTGTSPGRICSSAGRPRSVWRSAYTQGSTLDESVVAGTLPESFSQRLSLSQPGSFRAGSTQSDGATATFLSSEGTFVPGTRPDTDVWDDGTPAEAGSLPPSAGS